MAGDMAWFPKIMPTLYCLFDIEQVKKGLSGDYTWATRLRKCLMVWHRPWNVQKEKLVLAQTPNQKTTLLPRTLPLFFCPTSRSQKQSEEGRPRILRLERESIPCLIREAGSQHSMGDIREKSFSAEISWQRWYLKWTSISFPAYEESKNIWK